jgi:hypothetical protein
MQIHHIVPDSEGGAGTAENGIPVCLDCHAEVESKSNMGRRFSGAELTMRRDRWFAIVRDRPEVLIAGSQSQTETGPLEALLAELEFNLACISGNPEEGYPPPVTKQFDRCIANNALSALEPIVRESIYRAYTLMRRISYHFKELAAMDRTGGRDGAWAATQAVRNLLRDQLRGCIPEVIVNLKGALGQA